MSVSYCEALPHVGLCLAGVCDRNDGRGGSRSDSSSRSSSNGVLFVDELLVGLALLVVDELNVGPVQSEYGVSVEAEALYDLLHGLLAHEYGSDVVVRSLVLLHLALPLGLEGARAAVVRLLAAVHNQVASQIAQVARHIRTLLTAQRVAVLACALCRNACI